MSGVMAITLLTAMPRDAPANSEPATVQKNLASGLMPRLP